MSVDHFSVASSHGHTIVEDNYYSCSSLFLLGVRRLLLFAGALAREVFFNDATIADTVFRIDFEIGDLV
jgi:hypothetical protein